MEAGRTGLHVILRVEVRTRGIGRAYGVDNRQVLRVEHGLERRQGGVQSENPVQIDGRVRGAVRLGDSAGGRQLVVTRFSEGDHHVQAIHRATLEDGDQDFLAGVRYGTWGGLGV